MQRVVAAVVVLAVVLSGLIAWRIRAQRAALAGPASGSGVVESDGVDLSSRIGARVARVSVAEGQRVAAGAVVVELVCDEQKARLREAEARHASARAQAIAAQAEVQAARGQSSAARANIGAIGAQAGALDAQKAVALREAARLESMGEHAAVSARDKARAAADNLVEQERALRASQVVTRQQASSASFRAEASLSLASAAAESERALEAQVASAKLLVDECAIRAPHAGIIDRVYYDPGELVIPSAVVARLVDPAAVRVTFYVASADVDRAVVGHPATVEADAYPGQTFQATVSRVGLEAEFTPRNVQTRSDRDRLVFPVEVRLSQERPSLRDGMPVTVTLVEGKAR